jgi:phosphoribosylformimino-5-aminoimidazole carboxamide ribotide isomerase
MELIPAIDILARQVVRLHKGKYANATVFSDDPVATALHWESLGATRLHVIDLDGASEGISQNLDLIEQITSQLRIPIQLGGGIRSLENATQAFQAGVDRIIIGTKAIENSVFIKECISLFGDEKIIVAVDSQKGKVAVKGWREITSTSSLDLLKNMEQLGVLRFLVTDIDRDGTLRGPNVGLIQQVATHTNAKILAAGGVHKVADLKMLSDLNIDGTILGKALYSGTIDLKEALMIID